MVSLSVVFQTNFMHGEQAHPQLVSAYGVVPKRLLTFLGSLYKEVVKTTSGTLVYRLERQTA